MNAAYLDRLGPYSLNSIITGDTRELAKAIPDESVDLIFTDPPYHKHNAYLFEILARVAARVLKKGGLLLALTGQPAFDYVFSVLSEYLDYYWVSNMPHSLGCVGRYHPRQIMCGSKPFLWFSKGKVAKHKYVFDTFLPKRDKRHHPMEWFIYYIDKLTNDGDVVLDLFCGGGTVPAACKTLNRNYLAFEIDPDTAELARQRVANTQPPLPMPKVEQVELSWKEAAPACPHCGGTGIINHGYLRGFDCSCRIRQRLPAVNHQAAP